MDDSNSEFNYLIATNASFMVISFVGPLNKDSLPKLDACEREASTKEGIKFAVLYFRDTPNITSDAVPFLTNFQMKLRGKHELKVCSLRPELKEKLAKLGVIRGMELSDNLQDALLTLKASR